MGCRWSYMLMGVTKQAPHLRIALCMFRASYLLRDFSPWQLVLGHTWLCTHDPLVWGVLAKSLTWPTDEDPGGRGVGKGGTLYK